VFGEIVCTCGKVIALVHGEIFYDSVYKSG